MSPVCQSVHKKDLQYIYQQSLSVQKHLINEKQVNNYTDFSFKDLKPGLTPVLWLSPTLGLRLEKPLFLTAFKRQNSYCRWDYTSKSSALTGTSFLIPAVCKFFQQNNVCSSYFVLNHASTYCLFRYVGAAEH